MEKTNVCAVEECNFEGDTRKVVVNSGSGGTTVVNFKIPCCGQGEVGVGMDGVGVPEGGTTGQVLAKKSDDDFETEWVDPVGTPGESAYEIAVRNGFIGTEQEWLDSITNIGEPTVGQSCSGIFQDQPLTANVYTQLTPVVQSGTASLVSGKRFVAPFNGVCEIACSGSLTGVSGAIRSAILKNADTYTPDDLSNCKAFSYTGTHATIQPIMIKFEVKKSDYVSYVVSNSVASATINASKSVSQFYITFTPDGN